MLLKAGNYVRFVPISEAEYEEIAARVAAGTYEVQQEPLTKGGTGQ